jgi:glycosyltransferase involved in cell wall biosynthesis
MKRPLVSVITTARNAEMWIAETIASVRAQTEQRFEQIIIDDGSADQTANIAHREIENDRRISLHAQKYGGLAAARTRGLQIARGDFVTFLDAGDVWEPTFLGDMNRALASQKASVGGVVCASTIVDERGIVRRIEPVRRQLKLDGLLRSWTAPAWSTTMVRRSVLDDGFDPSYGRYADLHMWLRILASERSFTTVSRPLVRLREQTHVSTKEDIDAMQRLLDEYGNQLGPFDRVETYRRVAVEAFDAGQHRAGRDALRRVLPFGLPVLVKSPEGRTVLARTVARMFAR